MWNWSCACRDFFSRGSPQRWKGGRKTLIVRGLRTGKRAKVAGNLLHISSYWGANIIHTERWFEHKAGWIMLKKLPFCSKNSGPSSITSWSHEKRYQALHAFHVPGSLGTRLYFTGGEWSSLILRPHGMTWVWGWLKLDIFQCCFCSFRLVDQRKQWILLP